MQADVWLLQCYSGRKKNGTLCLCIDYKGLNAVCVENVYLLLLMKNMLTYLAKGEFSLLDLRAYYRVYIKDGDEWKMAFNCPLGCFQFHVPWVTRGTLCFHAIDH